MTMSTTEASMLPPGWPAMSIAEAHARLAAPGHPLEVEEVEIRGARTRVWRNQPATVGAVALHAQRYADREFLVYEDERITYGAFLRAVAAFAAELESRGVRTGDRVAIAMRNLPEWAAAFYGASALGAIVTPLNAWWTGSELVYGLEDSGAKVAVVDAERLQRLAETEAALPALERIYVCRAETANHHPRAARWDEVVGPTGAWETLPDRPPPAPTGAADDPATLFYTSGTTGRPKGVLSSHRGFNSNILTLMAVGARRFLRRGETPPAPALDAPQRTSLLCVPLFHVAGCQAALNCTLFAGGRLVMMRRFDPVRAFELIARERVSQAGGVTAIAWQLVEHPARADHDLSSLEMINYGGAPCPPELLRRIVQTFPGVQCRQGWGMTETNGTVTSNNSEDFLNRPESCGVPAATAELQIRDTADGSTVLPTGATGEVWAKGPMCAIGYWNRPDATAETFVDGWVRTGDLGRLDEEGFCYIVDRAKDVLIRGGENISCIEVENALYTHPAVIDAAVVGVPHRVLGEEPAAVVALRPGASATEAELRAHVAAQLAAFKAPVQIRFWPEALPRNATGKVLKAELRRLFVDGQAPA
jgi:long-chain acyl-CoA synthetase